MLSMRYKKALESSSETPWKESFVKRAFELFISINFCKMGMILVAPSYQQLSLPVLGISTTYIALPDLNGPASRFEA